MLNLEKYLIPAKKDMTKSNQIKTQWQAAKTPIYNIRYYIDEPSTDFIRRDGKSWLFYDSNCEEYKIYVDSQLKHVKLVLMT
jgi:hypothetical protein